MLLAVGNNLESCDLPGQLFGNLPWFQGQPLSFIKGTVLLSWVIRYLGFLVCG